MLRLLLPGPRLGGWRVGDEVGQVVGGGHLHPGRGRVHPDGYTAVLVRPVLDDALAELGLPHLLGQLAPPPGQLEVDEDVLVREAFSIGRVLASEEAGGENLPGTTWPSVYDSEDVGGVGSLLSEGVAGRDVTEEQLDTGLELDEPDHHLGIVLLPDIVPRPELLPDHEAVFAPAVWRRDD